MFDIPAACEATATERFVAITYDRRGKMRFRTAAYLTRDEAHAAAFAGDPQARSSSSERASPQDNGKWQAHGFDIRNIRRP